MISNDHARQQLITDPDSIAVIILCLHQGHIEMTASVLEIATNICWVSDEGCEIVLKSLENY